MNSCLYEGWVRHRRFEPTLHEFRYSIFMTMIDLDEIDHVFRGISGWSTERFAFAWFRRQDHFGPSHQDLKHTIQDFVEESGFPRPSGPIRLLTNLRFFGYVFNPVSFFYCFNADGFSVDTIVAEVHNTPWNERHCYVLPIGVSSESEDHADLEQDKRKQFAPPTIEKTFHVSPFMPMDVQYLWNVRSPADNLMMHIENRRMSDTLESRPFFDVTLQMKRREISSKQTSRLMWRYPWMTARISTAIYWQALRLWMKKSPFHAHPSKLQTS